MIAFAPTSAEPSAPSDCRPEPPDPARNERDRMLRAERLGDDIARLGAHLDAALYRQLVMIREFDELEGWHHQGSKSCAQWLSWRTGLAPGAARERVRVARALEPLPHLSDAMRRGRLSYSAARALTRIASPENEEELVEVARHTTASQLERLVRGWRAVDRASEAEGERIRHEQRGMSLVPDPDGSWVQRGRLDPEVGAEEARLLDLAERILRRQGVLDPEATATQRRADAFALLIEAARGGIEELAAEVAAESEPVDEHEADAPVEEGGDETVEVDEAEADAFATPEAAPSAGPAGERRRSRAAVSSRADRFQVVVHVSAETLRASGHEVDAAAGDRQSAFPNGPTESRIEGGPRVSAETARRLCCDAGIVVMTHDAAGNVLDVGRRTRSVPTPIRRALDYRDDGCRFPGCWSRICDAHHLHHWADGGATKLDNLVLLCAWHHRRVHEDGWRVETDATGELRFERPDGRRLPAVPPRPEWADDPDAEADAAEALRGRQRDLDIDPWTPTTRWEGHPFDVDWALFTLRPPAELEWRPAH